MWYTFYHILRPINHRVVLFTWMIYVLYLPIDNLLWFLLDEKVYLVLSLILKIVIVFTITDTVSQGIYRKADS